MLYLVGIVITFFLAIILASKRGKTTADWVLGGEAELRIRRGMTFSAPPRNLCVSFATLHFATLSLRITRKTRPRPSEEYLN
jgi:hypothetical protein